MSGQAFLISVLFGATVFMIIAGIHRLRSYAIVVVEDGSKKKKRIKKGQKPGIDDKIQDAIYRSGIALDVMEAKILMVIAGVIIWLIASLLTGQWIIGLFLGIIGSPYLFFAVFHWLGRKQSRLLEMQFGHEVVALAAQMEAGVNLSQALRYVEENAQEPIKRIFVDIVANMDSGATLEDSLKAVSKRIDIEDWPDFVAACIIGTEAGGAELPEMLSRLSTTISDRILMRSHAKSLIMEAQMSKYVLSALPPVVFLFTLVTSKNSTTVLTKTTTGFILIGLSSVLWLLGNFTISKMVKKMEASV